MAGSIRWISNQGNNNLYFDVDLSFDSRPLAFNPCNLGESPTVTWFTLGDAVAIESLVFVLPYQYGQAEAPTSLNLSWIDKNSNTGPLLEFGSSGLLDVPDFNQEYKVAAFVETPSLADSPWTIELSGAVGWVNMFNVPAALDLTREECRLMLKVRSYWGQII